MMILVVVVSHFSPQFLVVAVEGFINEMNLGQKRNVIPFSYYFYLVLMFLSVNVLNNYALNFHIPLPLHMIFRSGSLIANLIKGRTGYEATLDI